MKFTDLEIKKKISICTYHIANLDLVINSNLLGSFGFYTVLLIKKKGKKKKKKRESRKKLNRERKKGGKNACREKTNVQKCRWHASSRTRMGKSRWPRRSGPRKISNKTTCASMFGTSGANSPSHTAQ